MSQVTYPCAACKITRRKCGDKCMLAPYFPPEFPDKFLVVRKVFGTSKLVKRLQDISHEKRKDAVESMVFEATSRVRNPVYGCTGTIYQLLNQISELQSQLVAIKTELLITQASHASLVSEIYSEREGENTHSLSQSTIQEHDALHDSEEPADPWAPWAPLWT